MDLECGIPTSQLREAGDTVLEGNRRVASHLPRGTAVAVSFAATHPGNVMSRGSLFVSSVVAFLLVVVMSPAAAQTSPKDFTLRNQYDSAFTLSSERGRFVLLLYSDRKGSQFVGGFSRAARQWRRERGDTTMLRIINIANLDGVPRLLRGTIKGNFKGNEKDGRPKALLLLDWDAKLAKLFGGAREDATTAWIIGPDGALLWSGGGTYKPGETEAVSAALTAAADAHPR